MISLGDAAEEQLAELLDHYGRLGRAEAQNALLRAVDEACNRIERDPSAGITAPRPYPQLARPGERWIKAGRYWIAYSLTKPPVILAVFYDTADIPARR